MGAGKAKSSSTSSESTGSQSSLDENVEEQTYAYAKFVFSLILLKIFYTVLLLNCIVTVLPHGYFSGEFPLTLPSKPESPTNPVVSLSFTLGTSKKPLEIVAEIFEDRVPLTARNFIELGMKKYQGTTCDRIIPGFLIQCGNYDQLGGRSIYGKYFDDEDLGISFKEYRYPLAMANHGPNTNGSTFFISTGNHEMQEGLHVIFGRVLDTDDSYENVHRLEATGSLSGMSQVPVTLKEFNLL